MVGDFVVVVVASAVVVAVAVVVSSVVDAGVCSWRQPGPPEWKRRYGTG